MDNRKNNGGNSTKAKGIDKRKNEFKDLVSEAISEEDIKNVFKMLLLKSTEDKDTKASEVLLSYRIGKPTQTIEQTNVNYNQELTPEETERILKEIHSKY